MVKVFYFYFSPLAIRICNTMNTEANISFSLKAYIKKSPFITLGVCILIITVLFGLSMKNFEYYNKPMIDLLDTSDTAYNSVFSRTMKKFHNILNSFWLIIVTFTTSK